MKSKYRTFDDQEVGDGYYFARYKTDWTLVLVKDGKLFSGPWFGQEGIPEMLEEHNQKHHDFRPVICNESY
jgi:hypothetical protein